MHLRRVSRSRPLAARNVIKVGDEAVAKLTALGYNRWGDTTYVGESFGNAVNARMSEAAAQKTGAGRGNALILNAADPAGFFALAEVPDYKADFKDSISIMTWDMGDDGSEVGDRSLGYLEPKESHCGADCNITGESHTSGIYFLRRLLTLNPNLARLLLAADYRTLGIPDRKSPFYDGGINANGELLLGDLIPVPVYYVNGYDITPGRQQGVTVVRPIDPNDKQGPTGYGAERYISGDEPLFYMINFENQGSATAPVQQLVVTDQLDPD